MAQIKPKKRTVIEGKEKGVRAEPGDAESEWRDRMEGRTAIKARDKPAKPGAKVRLPGAGYAADTKMASRYKRTDKKTHEGR
jgi:hypothetical protein